MRQGMPWTHKIHTITILTMMPVAGRRPRRVNEQKMVEMNYLCDMPKSHTKLRLCTPTLKE
jgi:hypothetical protein